MSRACFRSDRVDRGFTLLELLVVMAIILILAAAVVPSLINLFRSSRLTNASLTLMDSLNFARQTALTNNCPVELRIYKTGEESNAADLQYRAFRLFTIDDVKGIQPLANLKRFPNPVIISSGTQFSSLMTLISGTSGLPTDYPMPDKTAYIAFQFRPSGGTSLLPIEGSGSNWFLTLLMENTPVSGASGLPANYFTIQIDPVTGRARSFRP